MPTPLGPINTDVWPPNNVRRASSPRSSIVDVNRDRSRETSVGALAPTAGPSFGTLREKIENPLRHLHEADRWLLRDEDNRVADFFGKKLDDALALVREQHSQRIAVAAVIALLVGELGEDHVTDHQRNLIAERLRNIVEGISVDVKESREKLEEPT